MGRALVNPRSARTGVGAVPLTAVAEEQGAGRAGTAPTGRAVCESKQG